MESPRRRRSSYLQVIKELTPQTVVMESPAKSPLRSSAMSISQTASDSGYSTVFSSSSNTSSITSATAVEQTPIEFPQHKEMALTDKPEEVQKILDNIAKLNNSQHGNQNPQPNNGSQSTCLCMSELQMNFLNYLAAPPNEFQDQPCEGSEAMLEAFMAHRSRSSTPQGELQTHHWDIITSQRSPGRSPNRTGHDNSKPAASSLPRIIKRKRRQVATTNAETNTAKESPFNLLTRDANTVHCDGTTPLKITPNEHAGNTDNKLTSVTERGISDETSPVLKRLFSTTLARGLQIYTDWANHYLDKVRSSKRVQDLQKDLSDGVLLVQIVQSVTGHQLESINFQPRSAAHMLKNLSICIEFLRELGVNVDDLAAKDIHEGNLKCVLGLFFNLSRYKQQQKQQHKEASSDMSSRIPGSGLKAPTSSLKKTSGPSGSSKSPIIISANVNNNNTPKRSGLQPPGQRLSTGSATSAVSSRSSSPITSAKLSAPGSARLTRKDNSTNSSKISTSKTAHSSSAPQPQTQTQSSSSQPPTQSSGGRSLSSLFKTKKTPAATSKSTDSKPTKAQTKKEKNSPKKSSKDTSSKESSSKSKPPLSSSIPRGGSGGLSSRSRTPSRESLYKCRIQPPTTNKPNRLSSDSGIHSPAELKLSNEGSASGLTRNNSLPSSRVHSTKESALSKPTRLATNSPSLQKKLGVNRSVSTSSSTNTQPTDLKLQIPPPLPSSKPNSAPSSNTTSNPGSSSQHVYNQMPGINHYLKPPSQEKMTPSVQTKPRLSYQNKDNINEARKLQNLKNNQKVDGDTQTDTSALQRRTGVKSTSSDDGSSLVKAAPEQKSSISRIMSLTPRQQTPGAESSHMTKLNPDISDHPKPERIPKTQPDHSQKLAADSEIIDSEEKDDAGSDFQVEAMQPLDKLASYEFLQRIGRSQPNQPPANYKSPLSRFGYMNRSFNTKNPINRNNIHEDYASDVECYTNGYISDSGCGNRSSVGDYSSITSPTAVDMSGYLSEGGASNYARRLQQRFHEGMQLVREALDPPHKLYKTADDDDSFDEDEASSISSGDLSDTLDLVDEAEPTSTETAASNPTYGYIQHRTRNTPDGKTGRMPLSLARSSAGYMSDSSCTYSITEQAIQEQARAKGLISSKTQQTLVNQRPGQDDLYKYYTLGRTNRGGSVPSQSYALMNGPPSVPYIKHNPYLDTSSTPADRSSSASSYHARTLSLTGGRLAQHRTPPNPYFTRTGQSNAPASHLHSHIHQGGYESDSGVVERKLCQNCCQPLEKDKLSDVRGSAASLASNASSLYSTFDERRDSEVQKLRQELDLAKQHVFTLTNQLTTNAHVVQAFEQSLGNMTMRLHSLQSKSDQKDSELGDMRQTLDNLRRMTGLAHTEILQSQQQAQNNAKQLNQHTEGGLVRQMSADSINSLNSITSNCSSQTSSTTDSRKNKQKKNWIRNSFSKAFGGKKKAQGGSMSDVEGDTTSCHPPYDLTGPTSAPGTPTHAPRTPINLATYLYADPEEMTPEAITDMKKMLREKEMKLTDIRLDALTSAHQLEQLREAMNKMKHEMTFLKADNERLHKIVGDKSQTGSTSGSTHQCYISPSASLTGNTPASFLSTSFSQHSPSSPLGSPIHRALSGDKPLDFLSQVGGSSSEGENGKRVTVSVVADGDRQGVGCYIGSLSVTGKTKWDILDSLIKKIFKQYLSRIDQSTNLGLNSESIHSFIVGEIYRSKSSDNPELLPYGYLVGDITNIKILLKGSAHNSVDSLAFETGIPKAIIQRYVSLLAEHKRIILSGPTGTGKSHLAKHLAQHLMTKASREDLGSGLALFDCSEGADLKQYLISIQKSCESESSTVPYVIILDNLHHITSLGDSFTGFFSPKSPRCPYIIGTMSQTSSATTNLQLHHNFRWILCANHMEPVKGFLARFLRRKLVQYEVTDNTLNNDLCKIIEWIPKVWQHFNKFIETHNNTDATIGPRQFLDCPMDVQKSQKWFSQFWNHSLMPYLKETIKDGILKYGQKSAWEEPTDWLIQTYPWQLDTSDLLHLRAEDVGYDKEVPISKSGKDIHDKTGGRDVSTNDPLYNMILRLREASYSNNDDNLDSHSSTLLES